MSKTKNKNKSETEHFRGMIKALERENKSLKQRLKRLEKMEHFFDDNGQHTDNAQDEEVIPANTEDTYVELCKSCGKGALTLMDLGPFVYKICQVCRNTEKIK